MKRANSKDVENEKRRRKQIVYEIVQQFIEMKKEKENAYREIEEAREKKRRRKRIVGWAEVKMSKW